MVSAVTHQQMNRCRKHKTILGPASHVPSARLAGKKQGWDGSIKPLHMCPYLHGLYTYVCLYFCHSAIPTPVTGFDQEQVWLKGCARQ